MRLAARTESSGTRVCVYTVSKGAFSRYRLELAGYHANFKSIYRHRNWISSDFVLVAFILTRKYLWPVYLYFSRVWGKVLQTGKGSFIKEWLNHQRAEMQQHLHSFRAELVPTWWIYYISNIPPLVSFSLWFGLHHFWPKLSVFTS